MAMIADAQAPAVLVMAAEEEIGALPRGAAAAAGGMVDVSTVPVAAPLAALPLGAGAGAEAGTTLCVGGAAAPVGAAAASSSAAAATAAESDDGGEEGEKFEGPEKCLEVDFCQDTGGPADGLHAVPREMWDALLAACGCEIISVLSNASLKSFVLSESSLFVYQWKLTLKTCGTTTPLNAIPHLQGMCRRFGFEMEWMGFSRKNYNFPVLQVDPHTNFSDEVRYIQHQVHRGEGHILGPLTGDHWYLYVAELTENYTHPQTDFKMDIMMYGLDPDAAALFFNTPGAGRTAEQVRKAMDLDTLLAGAQMHDVLFEPCGYSLNAVQDATYYTMHVTPEPEFSYASFETNRKAESYEELVQFVLGIFKPERFTITVFYDVTEDLAEHGMMRVHPPRRLNPLDQLRYSALGTSVQQQYQRCCKTETQFLGEWVGGVGNWKRINQVTRRTPKARLPTATKDQAASNCEEASPSSPPPSASSVS